MADIENIAKVTSDIGATIAVVSDIPIALQVAKSDISDIQVESNIEAMIRLVADIPEITLKSEICGIIRLESDIPQIASLRSEVG